MAKKHVAFRNIKIQYSVSGKGPVVLLLHGFGEDSSIWDGWKEPLQKEYTLIIPDVPGSGGSEMIKDKVVQIEDYAEVIHQIITQEQPNHFVMAGHSMGGYISLAYAKKYAKSMKALALIHSSAYADTDEKKDTRKKAIKFISSNGSEAFLKKAVPDLFAGKDASEQDIERLINSGKSIDPSVLIQYYEALMSRNDTTDILKQAPYPVLFLLGEHDKAVPLQQGLEQSHLPETAHVHILRHSGHMSMLEEKEKSLDIFTHFLQGIYV